VLVHLVADYGPGDLAAAEVRSSLAVHLPGADVVYTPVGPFDTVAAGFCVAQLALGVGPADRLVHHNVAPREDRDEPRQDNNGEPLVAARLSNGVLVVGVAAGSTFAFVRDEVEQAHLVDVPSSGSQFRSRDAFPPLLRRLLAGDTALLGERLEPVRLHDVPPQAVAYVDGYGNLKTTWQEPPAEAGTRVRVRVGEVEAEAVVGGGTFAVPAGELSFAPGSSGWATRDGGQRRSCELLARAGARLSCSAFRHPAQASTSRSVSACRRVDVRGGEAGRDGPSSSAGGIGVSRGQGCCLSRARVRTVTGKGRDGRGQGSCRHWQGCDGSAGWHRCAGQHAAGVVADRAPCRRPPGRAPRRRARRSLSQHAVQLIESERRRHLRAAPHRVALRRPGTRSP
jgi:hypothetical protein